MTGAFPDAPVEGLAVHLTLIGKMSVEGDTIMARAATRQSSAVSASNVTSDLSQSLQAFDLLDLRQYTREKAYSSTASKDFHLFFVGVTMSTTSSSTYCRV